MEEEKGTASMPSDAPSIELGLSTISCVVRTDMGDIHLELNNEKAPKSVANFLKYVTCKHYDGLIFHRIKPGFMIQGGGYDVHMKKKKVEGGVANEWNNGLKHVKGTVAVARRGGEPLSGTSQFFINTADNTSLDEKLDDGAGFAVFGLVIRGWDVVKRIEQVTTEEKFGRPDVPKRSMTIHSIRRVSSYQAMEAKLSKAEAPLQ